VTFSLIFLQDTHRLEVYQGWQSVANHKDRKYKKYSQEDALMVLCLRATGETKISFKISKFTGFHQEP
jgi:hypothetical protein